MDVVEDIMNRINYVTTHITTEFNNNINNIDNEIKKFELEVQKIDPFRN